VRGGGAGSRADAFILTEEGERIELDMIATVELLPGQRLVSLSSGGGGYGPPRLRDPSSVCQDVNEGWISAEAAEEVYGVAVVDSGAGWRLDPDATRALRDDN
jgi:N-methylhydantoinase B